MSMTAPERPPPPTSYSPYSTLSLPRRPLHPPKLQHVLVHDDEDEVETPRKPRQRRKQRRHHDLVKAEPRDDDVMKAPDFSVDDEDTDGGEAPRLEKSKVFDTDKGKVQSKYQYLGFGIWEDTDPTKPKPRAKKVKPAPPKRKEKEPEAEIVVATTYNEAVEKSPSPEIWYNCSVVVSTHISSKELDDLVSDLDSSFLSKGRRKHDVAKVGSGGQCSGELYEAFTKEDMSAMFDRAWREQQELFTEAETTKWKCHVCREFIRGVVITAMGKKFHRECFVCTYCSKPFKDRAFKSDTKDLRPYCYPCFEKLLGHFGNARDELTVY